MKSHQRKRLNFYPEGPGEVLKQGNVRIRFVRGCIKTVVLKVRSSDRLHQNFINADSQACSIHPLVMEMEICM